MNTAFNTDWIKKYVMKAICAAGFSGRMELRVSKFIMVKAKNSLPSLKFLEESYMAQGEKRFFNITGNQADKTVISSLPDDSYLIYVMVFSETDRIKQVEYLYLGICNKSNSAQGIALKVSICREFVTIIL